MNLTNQTTGNVLNIFLIIALFIGGLNVVTTFFYAYFYYDVYIMIAVLDQAVIVGDILIWFIACIIFLVWIYKVHADLNKLHSNYPISPLGSLARIMIPFYNLYGFWKVFSTMSNYFKENSQTMNWGKKLALMIPFYYISIFSSQIISRSISKELVINDNVIMLAVILEFMLVVVCFLMLKYIRTALPIIVPEHTNGQISS